MGLETFLAYNVNLIFQSMVQNKAPAMAFEKAAAAVLADALPIAANVMELAREHTWAAMNTLAPGHGRR